MSDKEFKVKKILCDISDVNKRTKEMEGKWLQALLRRIGIPRIMIKKRMKNDIGNQQWQHYLFDNFKLDVYNNKANNQVNIIKYIDGDKDGKTEVIAEWSRPEVIRINKRGQRPYCELRLRYWQLI